MSNKRWEEKFNAWNPNNTGNDKAYVDRQINSQLNNKLYSAAMKKEEVDFKAMISKFEDIKNKLATALDIDAGDEYNRARLEVGREALKEYDNLVEFIAVDNKQGAFNTLGEGTFNKFFSNPANVGERLGKAQLNVAVKQSKLVAGIDILNNLRKSGTPFYNFSFEQFKENPLYQHKDRYTGTDAQKLLQVIQNETGMSFKGTPYRKVEHAALYSYAGTIASSEMNSNIEFGLSDTMWQYMNRIRSEYTELKKVGKFIADTRSDLISSLKETEEVLNLEQKGTAHRQLETQGRSAFGWERASEYNQYGFIEPDVVDQITKANIATEKYQKGLKEFGSAYGFTEGPIVQKMSLGTMAFNTVDDLNERLASLHQEKSKATDIYSRAAIEAEIAQVKQNIVDTSNDIYEKYKVKPSRILNIKQDGVVRRDAKGNVLSNRLGKGQVENRVISDWSDEFSRAKALGETIRTKELGNVNVIDVNKSQGTARVSKAAFRPEEFRITISEVAKDILSPKLKPDKFRTKDLSTIRQDIIKGITKSDGVLFTVNGKIQNIITPDSVDQIMGKWKYVSGLTGEDTVAVSNRIRENVLGIVYKHAGWSLFGPERDKAISIANESYLEAVKGMKNISITTSKDLAVSDEVIKSFSETFNATFHKKMFAPGEGKSLFKGNMIIDKLMEEYDKNPAYQKYDAELFVKRSMDTIAADLRDQKYGYDIKKMSVEDIRKYMHEKYDMIPRSSSIGFESLRDMEEQGTHGQTIPTTEMRTMDPRSYTEKAFRKELNKISMGQAIDNLSDRFQKNDLDQLKIIAEGGRYGELNNALKGLKVGTSAQKADIQTTLDMFKSEFTAGQRNLHNKISAARNITGKIIGSELIPDPSKLAFVENDFLSMMDLQGAGVFSKADIKEIITRSEEYLGYKDIAFKDEATLRKMVTSLKDVNVTRDGQGYQLRMNPRTGEVEALRGGKRGVVEGIVGKADIYNIDTMSNAEGYVRPGMRPSMMEQSGVELYNNMATDKAALMYDKQGVRRYMSHTPTSSIQALREIVGGKDFVALDYETTGLPGKTANELLIPTEIYAAKRKVTGTPGAYSITGTDEYHKYVKPTEKVKQFVSSLEGKTVAELAGNQEDLWLLRNYAKYAPGLNEKSPELMALYTGSTKRIADHQVSELLGNAKAGMGFLESKGESLHNAMLGIDAYTKNNILVGQNIADADEFFRRFGIDNALATIEDGATRSALETAKNQKNKLADLMHILYMFNPNEETRRLEQQAKAMGVSMGTAHLGKDDTLTSIKILEQQLNKIPQQMRDIIDQPDKYALKKGDVIAKVYGAATDESVTQGVYKFGGITSTEAGVSAKLFKYGGEGAVSLEAGSISELQNILGKDFARIEKDDIKKRREYYTWDRARSNISKGITGGYEDFMKQRENSLYASGIGREGVVRELKKAQGRYLHVENKMALYEAAEANKELNRMIGLSKDDLKRLEGTTDIKDINAFTREWGSKAEAIKSMESRAINIPDRIKAMVEATRPELSERNKARYERLLSRQYSKMSTYDSAIQGLTDKDKIALMTKGETPANLLQDKIDRLSTEYTEGSIVGDRKRIYEKTAAWYNSKEAKIVQKAYQQAEVLSSIPTFGLNNREGSELLRSMNQTIKNATTKTKTHSWVKQLGQITSGEELKDLTVDTSSVTRAEQSIKSIRASYNIDLAEVKSLLSKTLGVADIDARNNAGLAAYIVANKQHMTDAVFKDITSPIKGKGLDELQTTLSGMINKAVTDKYANVQGGEEIAGRVLSHSERIMKSMRGMAAHYMTPSLGMTGMGAKDVLLGYSEEGLTTVDDMIKIAKSYKPQDYKGIWSNINSTFETWGKEQNLTNYGAQYKGFRRDFMKEVKEGVMPKLRQYDEELAGVQKALARDAWKGLVRTATENTEYTVNDIQRKALQSINWGTQAETMEMGVEQLRSQVMTEGLYAGRELGTVPLKELSKYRDSIAADGIKESKWLERNELNFRVEQYFKRLEETKVSHIVPGTVLESPYAQAPSFVTEDMNRILNGMSERIRPTFAAPRIEQAIQSGLPEMAEAMVREAGTATERIVQEAPRFNKKALAGMGIALGLAGFMAGGMRQPPLIPSNPEQQSSGTGDFAAQPIAAQNSRAASKVYQDSGVNINVSARSNKPIGSNNIASSVSQAVNNTMQTNINITTRDDTSKVTNSWLEDKFISILKG